MAKGQQATRVYNWISYKEPEMFNVVFINDDFTTQDFVVKVLMDVFFKSGEEAVTIMLDVHNHGEGIVGKYTLDMARSKTLKATNMARTAGFPLRIIVKPE